MRNNAFLLIALFVLFTSATEAQTNVDIRRKEFKTEKAGFKEAWEHVEKGDEFFISKGIFYGYALDEYLRALDFNDSNPELNYKAGVSALLSDKKDAAADLFLKAYSIKKDVTNDILFVTGKALQFAGRYDEAIENLNGYLNSPVKKKVEKLELAKKHIAECTSALDINKDTLNVLIENMGASINSSADDYSEVISSDGKVLYFASRRETPKSSDAYSDYKFDENIFVSRLNNDSWEMSVSAGKNLTTKYCEAPLFINKLNDNLYIYEGSENLGDIKVSVTKNGKWGLPRLIPFRINTSGRETSFTFSPLEDEIWYITDQGKDNLGGRDIYFIKKSANDKWSRPVNAGNTINTVYDEESIRFSQTGDTLYFSSEGHNTMGGFDIFYSIRDSTGKWGEAINYGYPVNTHWDEIFFYPSPVDPGRFWFVSNRSGGFGNFDIYAGALPATVRDTVPVAAILPAIVDSIPPPGLSIPADTSVSVVVADTAMAAVDTSVAVTYSLKSVVPAPVAVPVPVPVPVPAPVAVAPETVPADPMDVDFKNIYFDSGKTSLNELALKVLANDLEIFRKYPGIKVDIAGHTEKSEDEALNFKISEERAKTVRDYFVRNGIDASKIEISQYGSLMPAASNSTKEGRAKNSRVEIKIKEF